MLLIDPMMVVIFVVGLFGVLVWLLLQRDLTLKLQEEGLHAHGEVVHVGWDSDRENLIVKYVLHLQDGSDLHDQYTLQNARQKVPPAVGDAVEALYLPHKPRRHQRVGEEIGTGRLLFRLGALVLLMVVLVALALISARPRGASPPAKLRTYEAPLPTGEKRQQSEY
ncbi:hypothetical protein D7W82_16360 [Corallococcus sp. CA049B]|uniref:DUF3592 domain-containing protein n=1 Tax=Corallococcus sp. CA049B TaxID=2316730 RepID=UPI000EA1C924|nr:DUF3592 domain-containing protein [Corallococcus sp. CA049B]NOJ93300.1 hypothetical protein [Corallococcus coralloides]RKG86512.1 hypothetical protein D7W82_16360 [Corallococcus sp. CA049B]